MGTGVLRDGKILCVPGDCSLAGSWIQGSSGCFTHRAVFGRPLFSANAHSENVISTVTLCISVSEEHAISMMAKILRVSGDSSLREVLQEVGFDDRVDDVLTQRANCDDRHFL